MNGTTSHSFLDALRRSPLLTPAQQTVLKQNLEPHYPDTRSLARELLRLGWLTSFQINQLCLGRGSDLLLGPYVLIERLGEGGAGRVYKARHTHMNRIVALKVIRPELLTDQEVINRFQREIHVISRLTHPHVVHAYDAGPAGSTFYLVMEFVAGTDLLQLVKQQGPLPVAQCVDYLSQAALGLQHVHEQGLVHRDIKPSNLLVSPQKTSETRLERRVGAGPGTGERHDFGWLKILDLGLARLQRPVDEATANVTGANAVAMGTLDYMAPEQALDFHAVDIRADLYSLGCTLYYLLTGQPPFPGGTVAQKLMRHQQAEPISVEHKRGDVPRNVLDALRVLMAKQPDARFQAPIELVHALAPSTGIAAIPLSHPAPPGLPVAVAVTAPPVEVEAQKWRSTEAATAQIPTNEGFPLPGGTAPSIPAGHNKRTDKPPAGVWLRRQTAAARQEFVALLRGLPSPGGQSFARRLARLWPLSLPVLFFLIFTGSVIWLCTLLVFQGQPEVNRGGGNLPPPTNRTELLPSDKPSRSITNSIGMELVLIPRGKFLMGSPRNEPGRLSIEEQHEVEIARPFYLGIYEVTQKEYLEVMGANPSDFSATGAARDRVKGQDTSFFPVEQVTWHQAREFCERLSARPEEKRQGRTYRLPTEAEWEYACRGSQATPAAYATGPQLVSNQANFNGALPGGAVPGPFLARPTRVGSFPPNRFGLYDMHGNVAEWCADWHDPDCALDPGKQQIFRPENKSRAVRGGSWASTARGCRCAHRSGILPEDSSPYTGFRILLETPDTAGR